MKPRFKCGGCEATFTTAPAATRHVSRTRHTLDFRWQCPRCGALHPSTNEHCPCEANPTIEAVEALAL